jgi:hypothetical protein
MRKTAIFVIAFLLFFGCDTLWFKDSTIYNESSYDVTFKAKKADQVTVQSGKSIVVQNDMGAVLEYFESNVPKRVNYIQTDVYRGKFVDLPSIPVVINNTMSIPVTLSAGGYLDVDPMLNITANSDDSTNAIYTRTPVFTVSTSSFPATADSQIVDDVMYITVR